MFSIKLEDGREAEDRDIQLIRNYKQSIIIYETIIKLLSGHSEEELTKPFTHEIEDSDQKRKFVFGVLPQGRLARVIK